MPELPDVVVYCEALDAHVRGHVLQRVRLVNPFVLRTAVPPIGEAEGKRVREVRRLGKRIVLALDGELYLVIHLMIAGRLRWLAPHAKPPGRITLALLEFDDGTLLFTEAGTKRRASLHLVHGDIALTQFDMGGLEVVGSDLGAFSGRLTRENHTVKRALTDPRLVSGIGNAYSDEILHRAPALAARAHGKSLSQCRPRAIAPGGAGGAAAEWTERLRAEARGDFRTMRDGVPAGDGRAWPKLRPAVPGMRVTGAAWIVYAENEANYCALPERGRRAGRSGAVARLLHWKSFPRTSRRGLTRLRSTRPQGPGQRDLLVPAVADRDPSRLYQAPPIVRQ